jgi:phosphoribosylaminoimidazole carboxylase (NCAIR synthetase)
MLAMAAARLGLRCQVFSADPDSPAFDVVQNATCAEYADVEALELFANDCDVITYEFENIPAGTAMVLAARKPVLPDLSILQTTQDRLADIQRMLSQVPASQLNGLQSNDAGFSTMKARLARLGPAPKVQGQ